MTNEAFKDWTLQQLIAFVAPHDVDVRPDHVWTGSGGWHLNGDTVTEAEEESDPRVHKWNQRTAATPADVAECRRYLERQAWHIAERKARDAATSSWLEAQRLATPLGGRR